MSILSREYFTNQILNVKKEVLRMGEMVEEIIDSAVVSLKTQDLDLAKKVIRDDKEINQLELEIEKECMMIITLQQPLASDLRTIASALKIITDLERMADNAVNIANITLDIGKEPFIKTLVDIPNMAKIAQEMLKLSLEAFVNEDLELAEKAAMMDEKVDILYDTVLNDVLDIIIEKKEFTKQGTKLLFAGRYLERIADHSTNICERIIYMISGKLKHIN